MKEIFAATLPPRARRPELGRRRCISTGTSYKVAEARFEGNDFTAHIVDKAEGLSVAVARTKGQFQVGTARSFGEVESLGPATRTAAAC